MTVLEILHIAIELDAADIFLVAGLPVTFKCGGKQVRAQEDFLRPDAIAVLVDEIYTVGRRDRAKLSEALCHTWQLEDPGDGSVVLLAFHSDGSGICTRQAWLFEETIAAFSYDVTGKDTIVLHYNGADLEYVVTFEQDKTALRFSPNLLVQNRPDERWTIYRATP